MPKLNLKVRPPERVSPWKRSGQMLVILGVISIPIAPPDLWARPALILIPLGGLMLLWGLWRDHQAANKASSKQLSDKQSSNKK